MNRATGGAQDVIDLTDVDLFVTEKHHDALRRLRERHTIHRNVGADGTNFWALTRYDDVHWAYRNHELFSSARGAVVGGSFRSENDTSAGRMLVASDLPRHRQLKQVIHPALSAAVAEKVGVTVSELVENALARLVADGGGDFATDVATELPAGALMVVMGIDHEEAHELITLTRRMVGYQDETFVDLGEDARFRLAWLQADIFEFFVGLVDRRRRQPGEDLVSHLLTAELDGRRLTEDEIFYNCMNVAVGGNETSSYTACTGLLALTRHPEQYSLLIDTPDLIPSALDEILRWSSTNAYVQRVANQDVMLGDVKISHGDSVTLWNVAANRDPEQFPDPELFDVRRRPNRHLTYGAGIHRCIGASVAGQELTVLLQSLLATGVQLEADGPHRNLRSNFILGITSLPVRVG